MEFFDACFVRGGIVGLPMAMSVPLPDIKDQYAECLTRIGSVLGRGTLLLVIPMWVLWMIMLGAMIVAPLFFLVHAIGWLLPTKYRPDFGFDMYSRRALCAAVAYLAVALMFWGGVIREIKALNPSMS